MITNNSFGTKISIVTAVLSVLVGTIGIQPATASSSALVEIAREGSELALYSPSQGSLGDEYSTGDLVATGGEFEVSVGHATHGAVQLLIEIASEAAPEAFDFGIPGAVSMENISFEGGEIFRLVDADQQTIAWLAPPWALDSRGQQVETSFEFSNGILKQYVNHQGMDLEYPVAADPFLGIALISDMTISWLQGSYKLSVAVTPWVGVIYAGGVVGIRYQQAWVYGVAYAIMSQDGWSELLTVAGQKYGFPFRQYTVSRSTYKNQWDCHALGAPAIFFEGIGGPNSTWDLEGHRPTTTNLVTWVTSLCNWH